VSSSSLRNTLRGAYGRGVARLPVAVPRGGLEMASLRPSREIAAAVAPLYLAASIPLCLLFLLSMAVVYSEPPPPGKIVVTEFEVPAAPPHPVARPLEPEPVVAKQPPQPEPEPTVAQRVEPTPAARPIEIEIDAVDPVASPLPRRSAPARIAAVRVPVRSEARPIETPHVDARDSLALVAAVTRELPRSRASLPAVSTPGPAARLDGEIAEAGEPANFAAALGSADAPQVAALPETPASDRGGLGFTPVGRDPSSGGGSPGGAIAGVPLEALAPCESLAREDELKLVLLRGVSAGNQCSGEDGTYRFIETRNVNAFSMGVREPSARALGNRCEELERAIACVENQRNGRVEP